MEKVFVPASTCFWVSRGDYTKEGAEAMAKSDAIERLQKEYPTVTNIHAEAIGYDYMDSGHIDYYVGLAYGDID